MVTRNNYRYIKGTMQNAKSFNHTPCIVRNSMDSEKEISRQGIMNQKSIITDMLTYRIVHNTIDYDNE